MPGELTDKVKIQIEEILKATNKPEIDVNAVFARASEILEILGWRGSEKTQMGKVTGFFKDFEQTVKETK